MKWLRMLGYYGYSLFEMLLYFKNWPKMVPLFLHTSSSQTRVLKLRRPPLRIIVRSGMDVWSVKETFLDQFYTRYGVPVQAGWTVVDIGAGIGDFCLYATYGIPDVVLYAFEPYPNSCELLKRNLALNGVDNVYVNQKAIWSTSGDLHLNLETGEPLQFTSQEKSAEAMGANRVVVEALSLADMFRDETLKKIHLMKMDCEGAEYEILLNTPPMILERIERIIMEVHDINPVRTRTELIGFLETQRYRVSHYPNKVHENLGYLFATR